MVDVESLLRVTRAVYAAESIAAEPEPATLESYHRMMSLAAQMRDGDRTRPVVLGICGAQGSGKSTAALVIKALLGELLGLRSAVLSLDDLYLPRAARARLAATTHPLLATRGVPGTHDVGAGLAAIAALRLATDETLTVLPRFDKARDEPVTADRLTAIRGRLDVLIFEGWCVGAAAQPPDALLAPLNELERTEDADGRWRRYVNEQLSGPYQHLYALIDRLVLLRAPGFPCVAGWRREQEHKLAAAIASREPRADALHIMDDAAITRFIQHFERLTRYVLEEMPARAHLVVDLGPRREVLRVSTPRGQIEGHKAVR